MAIFGRGVAAGHVEQRHRHAASLCRSQQPRDVDGPVEAQQRVVAAEGVVERAAVGEEEVRRATARHGRRREAAHRVRRRRLAVVGDQRRAVVVVAEVQAGAAELLDVELVGLPAFLGADRVAFGALLLDSRRHRAARLDHLLRVVHREARHLLGDRQALDLVRVEDLLVGPAGEVRRQVPREVERVGDARVHAVAGVRHPQVSGVAGDEDAAVAEAVGDEAAADPVFLAEDLVLEAGIDAEDGADAAIAVDRLEVFLVRHQVVVDEPVLLAVDREADAAPARVARVAAPGTLAGNEPEQLRRADVGRLHALDHRRAREHGADRLANERAAAVAADQEAGADHRLAAAVEIARRDGDAVLVLDEAGGLAAIPDRHAAPSPRRGRTGSARGRSG